MYRIDRNNFYGNEKKATIFTPDKTSNYIFSLLSQYIDKKGLILDPCVGEGSLLLPFLRNGYRVLGIDIEAQGFAPTLEKNYLEVKVGEIETPAFIIMNPPFNIDDKTKEYIKEHYGSRPLLPEIWLQKAVQLFGKVVPTLMFTPYGFRLNLTQNSKRWKKFVNGEFPDISSIISLPKNHFDGILFHSEILIFNIPQLKPHYFCYM